MRVVLIHGYKSSFADAFWPWVRDELTRRGHDVITPELPNAADPVCQDWVDAINRSIRDVHGDTIFVAHNLGCVALLHYFEQANMSGTPKVSILINPVFHIGAERFASFFDPAVDMDTVEWKSQEYILLRAKDDTTIPRSHVERYERELNGRVVEVESGGSFSETTQMPQLLEWIDDRDVKPGDSLRDDFQEIDVVL